MSAMSLGNHASRAAEQDHFTRQLHPGNTFAVALMVATSAVATFDLYLFAASVIR